MVHNKHSINLVGKAGWLIEAYSIT